MREDTFFARSWDSVFIARVKERLEDHLRTGWIELGETSGFRASYGEASYGGDTLREDNTLVATSVQSSWSFTVSQKSKRTKMWLKEWAMAFLCDDSKA